MSTKMNIIDSDLCHFAFKGPFEQSFQPTANQICKKKLFKAFLNYQIKLVKETTVTH